MNPLADRLRPQSLDDCFGQEHLLGEGKILRNIIEKNEIPNMIFYGPSGVGKTTIVSMLGYAIASLGQKVLLVDMDFGLNNLDVLMGIENKIVYDIIDVLEEKCLPKQAIIEDFIESNLYIFPSTHSFCKRKFGSKELIEIISQVEYMFDYVIIDCPAGIDGGFKRAVECGGEHISLPLRICLHLEMLIK